MLSLTASVIAVAVLVALSIGSGRPGRPGIGFDARIAWLGLAAIELSVAIVANSTIGPPMVLSDEFTYAQGALELSGWWQAGRAVFQVHDLPNRLFLAVYSVAGTSQDPYATARALNVVALGLGLLGLLVASRELDNLAKGAIVGVAYSLGPLSTYGAYFMPDALFAGVFICVCVALATALAKGGYRAAVMAGAGCASLTFIKPHGWAVAAVAFLYSFAFAWRAPVDRVRSARRVAGVVAIAFVAAWVTLNAVLPNAANRGSFFGAIYGGVWSGLWRTVASVGDYPRIIGLLAVHLVVIGSIMTPVLVGATRAAMRPFGAGVDDRRLLADTMAGISLAQLLALIAMTSVFTVAIAGQGPGEVANRLHSRYFGFAIPLLVMAAMSSEVCEQFVRKHRRSILALWVAACALAFVLLPRFTWSFADSPELFFGWSMPGNLYAAFGAVGVVASILLWRSAWGLVSATVAAYLLSALVSGSAVRYVQDSHPVLPEQRAGEFASAMANEDQRWILLAGESPTVSLYRIAAYLPLRSRFVTREDLARRVEPQVAAGSIVAGESSYLEGVPLAFKRSFGTFTVGVLEGKGAAAGQAAGTSR
ncbi:MAG: hypothetical protein WA900_04770 [Casimicrobiaceae bacterium]